MKEGKASLLLLLTSLIWGLSFVSQSVSAGSVEACTFNSIRFFLGALVLVPFALAELRKRKGDKAYWRSYAIGSVSCGLCLAAASYTQQVGVGLSGAGKGGFITSFYLILVPFLSVLTGKKVGLRIWLSGIAAVGGMYLLTLGGGKTGIARGDLWLLCCALFFAFHIMVIDRTGKALDGISLSMGQFLVAGIVSFPGLVLEAPTAKAVLSVALPIAYSGCLSCGVAYTLQVVAQKRVSPSKATLLMSLESVWAAVGGAVILSERLTGIEAIGCIIVFASVLFSQLSPSSK